MENSKERLPNGIKPGWLACLAIFGTIEDFAVRLLADKRFTSKEGSCVYHVDRCTLAGRQIFQRQIELGNYMDINFDQTGFQIPLAGGCVLARYPFKDPGILPFKIEPMSDWLLGHALAQITEP